MSADTRTGYPKGYVPSWWLCDDCGYTWHDRSQQGRTDVAWECAPDCPDGHEMRRCSWLRAAVARLFQGKEKA